MRIVITFIIMSICYTLAKDAYKEKNYIKMLLIISVTLIILIMAEILREAFHMR